MKKVFSLLRGQNHIKNYSSKKKKKKILGPLCRNIILMKNINTPAAVNVRLNKT